MAIITSLCSQITNLFLGINEGKIVLYKIDWNTPPTGTQSVCIQYRVTGDPTWINATTNLSVDIYGNIPDSIFTILSNPAAGESYDIQGFNQCGSIAFETTFVFPEQIYSGSFLIDNVVYNICGNDAALLYSGEPFGVGVIMYSDIELITPLTGYSYIANVNTGTIYSLNSGTGEVGADTTYECGLAVANTVILGNDSGTICEGTIITVYSNEVPVIGDVLYSDLALSVPVIGYDYVLFFDTNLVYNLNSGTGVLGSSTGISCSAFGAYYSYSIVLSDIPTATPVQLYTSGSFGNGAIMYTDYALTTPLTGYNYISLNGEIRTIDSTTGEVGCLAVNC